MRRFLLAIFHGLFWRLACCPPGTPLNSRRQRTIGRRESVYWSQMRRSLLATALAFVVIAVPLAADVCEAACAEHAAHSVGSTVPASHHHHPGSQPSHHHHAEAPLAPTTQSAALTPRPHECGRLDAVVSESCELTRLQIAKAVVMMARMTPLLIEASPTSEMDSRHDPAAPTRSTSPLRI